VEGVSSIKVADGAPVFEAIFPRAAFGLLSATLVATLRVIQLKLYTKRNKP
jgi:hypothetical protein